MTIYEIKRKSEYLNPHFFTRRSLSFFGQRMSDFKVKRQIDGRILISAPMKDRHSGRIVGYTERYFDPSTNELQLH